MRRSQRTSQHGTQNVKTHIRTTQTTKDEQHGLHKNQEGYSYIQSSQVKVLAVIEERKQQAFHSLVTLEVPPIRG